MKDSLIIIISKCPYVKTNLGIIVYKSHTTPLHRILSDRITVLRINIDIKCLQPQHWTDGTQWAAILVVREVFVGRWVERMAGRHGGWVMHFDYALYAGPLGTTFGPYEGSRVEFMLVWYLI